MRTGIGFDVHAFCDGEHVTLGGVSIPHTNALAGHSDADVLVHAVMDALLGAAALPDIGTLFPDTDEQYKDISSIELAVRVKVLLERAGFAIVNVDCVLVAEMPRVAPYREQIKQNLSDALEIDKTRVGVKATTTEGLGFTGRKEGIAALATALVCCTKQDVLGEASGLRVKSLHGFGSPAEIEDALNGWFAANAGVEVVSVQIEPWANRFAAILVYRQRG
jgi:2-C-methyl-D-erythritol 2,4-cyclodiphosphate synthase